MVIFAGDVEIGQLRFAVLLRRQYLRIQDGQRHNLPLRDNRVQQSQQELRMVGVVIGVGE